MVRAAFILNIHSSFKNLLLFRKSKNKIIFTKKNYESKVQFVFS